MRGERPFQRVRAGLACGQYCLSRRLQLGRTPLSLCCSCMLYVWWLLSVCAVWVVTSAAHVSTVLSLVVPVTPFSDTACSPIQTLYSMGVGALQQGV